jgi:hypothetical protein
VRRWWWLIGLLLVALVLFLRAQEPHLHLARRTARPSATASTAQRLVTDTATHAAQPVAQALAEPAETSPATRPQSLDAAFCDPPDEPLPALVRTSSSVGRIPGMSELLARAHRAFDAGDDSLGRQALRAALELAPSDPWLLRTYGLAAAPSSDFTKGAAALQEYVRLMPKDRRAARLLLRLQTQAEVQRDFETLVSGGISLALPKDQLSDGESARSILRQIEGALTDAAVLTGTPRRKELYAVVYRDRSELLAVSCARSWTDGLYDGTLRLTVDGGRLEAALRHESLHAQLVPRIGASPRWFQEGLAQYLEEGGRFRWRPILGAVVKNHTYIPFSSMNASFQEFEQANDAGLGYAQAKAMVFMLAERDGETGIARAVSLLRAKTPPEALAGALGLTEDDLLRFLERQEPR